MKTDETKSDNQFRESSWEGWQSCSWQKSSKQTDNFELLMHRY